MVIRSWQPKVNSIKQCIVYNITAYLRVSLWCLAKGKWCWTGQLEVYTSELKQSMAEMRVLQIWECEEQMTGHKGDILRNSNFSSAYHLLIVSIGLCPIANTVICFC